MTGTVPSPDSLRVLLVAADPELRDAVRAGVEAAAPAVTLTSVDGDDGFGDLDGVDVVVVAGVAGERDRLDVVEAVSERRADQPVVVLLDRVTDERVGAAFDAGAADYFARIERPDQYERLAEQVHDRVHRRRTERGFREVFESVSDGLVVHDPESGEILAVNDRFCEMNGYDRAELVGADVGTVTATDEGYSYEEARERIQRAREEGSQLFEWRNQRKDGGTFPVEVHLSVVHFGGRERVLASVRDVSERERRQHERRRAEEQFDVVTRHLDEAIFIARGPTPADRGTGGTDAAETGTGDAGSATHALARWEFEYLTPAVERALDRPLADLYDDPTLLMELLVPEDRPAYDEWLRGITDELERGEPGDGYSVEYRVRDTDDEVRWVRTNAYPVELDDGGYRLVGITEDVTERRERRRRLRAERDRRSVLFENTPDPIVAVEFEDDRPMIAEVNAAFEEVFGFAAEEVVGQSVGEAVVPESEREEFETLRERAARGEQIGGEIRRETADGVRDFLFRVLPFEVAGDQHAYVWYTDITDRRRRERLVGDLHQATERLQEAETTQQACRAAVEAARDVLDLPMTACWLHREDGGDRLEPVAATEAVREFDPAPFEPGDVEYDAFEAGETLVYDPSEHFPANPLDAAIMLPLGDHGLLGVGERGVDEYESFVVDAARTLAGHVHTALDRVDRAERLRESERRLRLIAEHIDEVIYLANDDLSEILYINPAYEEVYGQPVGELESDAWSFLDAVHPADESVYEADIEAMIADVTAGEVRDAYDGEYRLVVDGETRWVHVTRYPVTDEEGSVDRIVGVVEDITERRRREREYEQIFNGVNDAIVVIDPDTGDIIDANESMCELVGYDYETVLDLGVDGLSVTDEGYTEDRGMEVVERVMESGEAETLEWKAETADGDHRILEVNATPATINGEPRYVAIQRDVTERKRRERTLETFHEATRELTEATSRGAASERAVAAATDILAFPFVSIYLYDESEGTLEPSAATDALESRVDALPSFGPGSAAPWQVFVEGEAIQRAEFDDATNLLPGVPDPELVLPLGSHGVMLVGGGDALDAERVELAQILAATVEAALNHVEGRRELERREAELQSQVERADRLDRLNALIRDVEQATVEESTREGIETAVCDRLTDVDPYAVAWIGEADPQDGTVTIRASAGADSHLTQRSLDAADGAVPHPAVAALETGEPQVNRRLARDARQAAWQKHALRRGHQAIAAVPLVHEAAVRGVLTVGADDPTAFDDDELEVLSELGSSIGYEISVLERRRALESGTTTELEFRVTDDDLRFVSLAARNGCRVDFERTIQHADGTYSTFYTVEGADPDALVETAVHASGVVDAALVSRADDDQVGVVELTVETWFGAIFTEYGGVVRTALATDGEGRLAVELPGRVEVREVVETFQDAYPDVSLQAKRQREREMRTLLELEEALADALTDRQLETLKTAYSAGYFEWPRGSSGQEIADLLGITQPTLNKHLRAAERKVFTMLLDREQPD